MEDFVSYKYCWLRRVTVWPHTPVIAIAFLLGVGLKRRYLSSLRDIPGPFLASCTIGWQLYHLIKGHTEVEIVKLHRQHGDFVRIADNEVSVAHPDAVKQLLMSQLPKGPWYSIFSFPDYNHVNLMSELDPKRHITMMRNVSAGYALSNIIKSEPYVDACLALLESQFDDLCKAGKAVEFDKWFNFFGFDVVGEVTFSSRFGFLDSSTDVGNAIANSKALGLYISIMGHFIWLHDLTLGNPVLAKLGIQPTSHITETCRSAINTRKGNIEARKDMMEEWMSMRSKFPERMDESEITAAAVVNIGAGADTVSSTLQGFFYWLLRSPNHLKRLRDEIDNAQVKGLLSPIVAYSEAQKLPFLQACIKETYRFHTAVGTGLPRVVPKGGITVGSRHFKEGTILSVNPWAFHRNALLFGEDCDTFNPERWLESEQRYKAMDRFLIHWGAGYNQCPGKNLAHFEISKAAATLVRDYDIEQVNPDQEWRFETHFTLIPYEWPCRVKRREAGVV
ncbi:cytochrome P450 [Glonium stellatum]|uniref:Cytochrome P450 n=1 Tax=Glonium stellatum TaxID=574774 RepID=A0A8E2JV16_9PEZI|nr:cytochrome P450 [Glonium stellatum]